MPDQPTLSREFHDALRPLVKRLDSDRSLSVGKLGVLGRLFEHGSATASELATFLRISPQAITLAVRELESLKLVERTHDDDDRRRIWITITDDGRQRLGQERYAGEQWFNDAIAARLSASDQKKLWAAIPALLKLTAESDS